MLALEVKNVITEHRANMCAYTRTSMCTPVHYHRLDIAPGFPDADFWSKHRKKLRFVLSLNSRLIKT